MRLDRSGASFDMAPSAANPFDRFAIEPSGAGREKRLAGLWRFS
jgi:hypothetical protein